MHFVLERRSSKMVLLRTDSWVAGGIWEFVLTFWNTQYTTMRQQLLTEHLRYVPLFASVSTMMRTVRHAHGKQTRTTRYVSDVYRKWKRRIWQDWPTLSVTLANKTCPAPMPLNGHRYDHLNVTDTRPLAMFNQGDTRCSRWTVADGRSAGCR